MAFDVRYQLVDQRSVSRVLAALIADHAAPPPSAFDRVADAAARWHALRAAWKSGDDARAAAAACAFAVSFSAANLPALVLRNVALTHRPLRMPDELHALDVPLGSPRSLFEYLTGMREGVVAALPDRIDHQSLTGAFINHPERAGRAVSDFLSARSLAPEIRYPAARLLALFRAAERANLAVWEAQYDGARMLAEHVSEAIALFWPGLARAAREGAPLSVEEWEGLDGRWLRTHGDLVDLVTMVELVDPIDVRRVAAARRALSLAFLAARPSNVYVDDDVLPRALAWLDRTLVAPGLAGEGVLAYAVLEGSFINRFTPRTLPADAFTRACEIATADQIEALTRCASQRPHDPALQQALVQVVIRLTPSADESTPDQQGTDLSRLLSAHRTGPIPAAVGRAIADRWYTLARVAPGHLAHLDGHELDDNSPCVHLLARILADAPSPASVHVLRKLFDLAALWRSDEDAMEHRDALSPFSVALLERVAAVRAFLARAGASDDAGDIEEQILGVERRASQVELRGLFASHRSGSIPADRARRIAQLWYELVFDSPDSIPDQRFEDDSPSAHMVDLLFGPQAPSDHAPGARADALLALLGVAPEQLDRVALTAALRSHLPALRALAGDDALALMTQLGLQKALDFVGDADLTGPPAARAEKLVRGWSTLPRHQHPVLNAMVQAGQWRVLVAAFARWLADSAAEPAELSTLAMRLTGALNVVGLTDPEAFDACLHVVALAFARRQNPNFLYNAACAHVRRGDIERAAAALAQAIALDPSQADDARTDTDFIPHLAHPALAAILRR